MANAHDTPLMKQYRSIKVQNPEKFLFFRMGDFYEVFNEDAISVSKILNITLTYRDRDKQVPMAGVPHHALNHYLAKMLEKGHKVVVCDQVGDTKPAKGLVERKIGKIVTPGTLVDEAMLSGSDHNYTAALSLPNSTSRMTGVACLDISTGDFSTLEFEDDASYSILKREIARIEPKEILLPEAMRGRKSLFEETGLLKDIITFRPGHTFDHDHAASSLKSHFNVTTLDGFGMNGKTSATRAAGALLDYLNDTQLRKLENIPTIKLVDLSGFMVIDSVTQRNLEIAKNLYHQKREGSLLHTIDMTSTPMGARQIREWLLHPLTDIEQINKRLDAVEEFFTNSRQRKIIRDYLKPISDMERIISRISLNMLTPRDMIALKESILMLPGIRESLKGFSAPALTQMLKLWDDLSDIGELIEIAIVSSPPATIRDGGVIKDGYNHDVDELKSILRNSKSIILEIEAKERKRTGIETLKIKYNNVFGYFIEISKLKASQVPDDYVRKQTLTNAERFINQELKEIESKILSANEKLVELEQELYENIRQKIAKEAYRVKNVSILIGHIDLFSSMAELAQKRNYVRPELHNGKEILIKGGRHPVIEAKDDRFIPNDIKIDGEENLLLIITGPNMAGKSTFMRQTALIVIMAQMGSYIPAVKGRIGIVDRVFTRVGASDNLLEGQSTFMVEMCETANILNNATSKSLIILDEIGRGTSTYDGLSIARAVAEYIQDKSLLGARTLFATHYHEMTTLEVQYEGVRNFSIGIKESGHKLTFLRKILPGAADKSYGVHVARLAGLPQKVIDRAFTILTKLETTPFNAKQKLKAVAKIKPASLFAQEEKNNKKTDDNQFDKLRNEISGIDLTRTTPIDALNKLNELQKKWGKKQ